MSSYMKTKLAGVVQAPRTAVAGCVRSATDDRGVGMLEFLVALLIFSIGVLGLLSAQLAGKKAIFEAAQRSFATALTRDILERIQANPGQVIDYQVMAAGVAEHRVPAPGSDCDRTDCSAHQLAAFDLWQWEGLLTGEPESDAGISVGGLVSPRACITSNEGVVEVVISWLGVMPPSQPVDSMCGSDDAVEIGGVPVENGDSLQRSQIAITTFVAQ
jgi:type IV pilus assembly protein PilV